ncbi:hypothetical protein CRG98_039212 [Punica granatum]|uniref:Uncharacterized protein n=1 Tax=Punica granatum TaxID=22663 RepID=A0A2I0IAH2_PUNGR|nr:hypothetical protein CRG98_039212 [Punica granatum]
MAEFHPPVVCFLLIVNCLLGFHCRVASGQPRSWVGGSPLSPAQSWALPGQTPSMTLRPPPPRR